MFRVKGYVKASVARRAGEIVGEWLAFHVDLTMFPV
jgi:hypothetical protein